MTTPNFKQGEKVETLCDYAGTPGATGVLTFKKGDIIVFSHIDASGWAMGELSGVHGWFPLQFVQLHVPPKPPLPPPLALRSQISTSSSHLPTPSSSLSSSSAPSLPAHPDTDRPRMPRPQSLMTVTPAVQLPPNPLAARKAAGISMTEQLAADLQNRLRAAAAAPGGGGSMPQSVSNPNLQAPTTTPSSSSSFSSHSSSSSSSLLSSALLSSSSSSLTRQRGDSFAMVEIRQLAAAEKPSTEAVDQASVIRKKQNTSSMLSKWLQTKRPSAEEMSAQGLLSTAGSLEMGYKPRRTKDGIFGMELEELLDAVPDRPIPIIVDQCVTYLRKQGMRTAGIFRVSPNNSELQKLRKMYTSPISLVDFAQKVTTPHTVAGLLKLWFYSLPEPLFPFHLYDTLVSLFSNPPETKQLLLHTKAMIQTLSQQRLAIFIFLFEFLHELSRSAEHNKMTPNNIGIVFGPNLLRPKEQSQTTMLDRTNVDVVEFIVENFPTLSGRI